MPHFNGIRHTPGSSGSWNLRNYVRRRQIVHDVLEGRVSVSDSWSTNASETDPNYNPDPTAGGGARRSMAMDPAELRRRYTEHPERKEEVSRGSSAMSNPNSISEISTSNLD